MNALESLGRHISAFSVNSLGGDFIGNVSAHLLDTVGSLAAGCTTRDGLALLKLYGAVGKRKIKAMSAASLDDILIRSAIARSTEADDIHMLSCVTPGSIVFPTVLTLFPKLELDLSDALDAISVGYESMIRLGLAISGPRILHKGMLPTFYCAAFGSAAITSKLLGLGPHQTANALSLALVTSSGFMAQPTAQLPFRWFAIGHAARAGCNAGFGAELGLTSKTDIIEEGWLVRACGPEARPELLTDAFDSHRDYLSEVSLKPYASAKQAVSAVEAFGRLLDSGINPDGIESVKVFVPAAYAAMISRPAVGEDRLSLITSVSMQLGLRAYHRRLLYDIEREHLPRSAKMKELISRVKVLPDNDLESLYPARYPAKVEVLTRDGEKRVESVTTSPGDPESPLSKDQRLSKFRRVIGSRLPETKRRELEDACAEAPSDKTSFIELTRLIDQIAVA